MSASDDRPDPDLLLRQAEQESRGRLKVFLGAAPGVGKTYEMLSEGAARKRFLQLLEAQGLEDPWSGAQRRRLSAVLFT